MRVLFIHGMGRSPLSGLPILLRLRARGFAIEVFGYSTALRDFASIRDRLRDRIQGLAARGPYALIGHSLGGVLLRSALSALPQGTRLPEQIFLLGSPVRSARLARRLRGNLLYRAATGDCGQLLACDARMEAIGPTPARTLAIIGVSGLRATRSHFGTEPNDGIVALSELQAPWIAEECRVPVVHTFLPSSALVAELLLARLETLRGPH
jgi:pimeloyl-ACP methyl ester carboxylesterase